MVEVKYLSLKWNLERYYNSNTKFKNFKEGDLVLRIVQMTGLDQVKGKLSQNCEGSYIIKKELKEGTH